MTENSNKVEEKSQSGSMQMRDQMDMLGGGKATPWKGAEAALLPNRLSCYLTL